MAVKPSWRRYYKLGCEAATQLDELKSFEEIGEAIGTNRDIAYNTCMVALGKLVYGIRKNLKLNVW